MLLNLEPHTARFLAWTFFVLAPTALGVYTLRRWRDSMKPIPALKRESPVSPPKDEAYAERLRSRYDFCTYESRFVFAFGSIAATLLSRSLQPALRRPFPERHDQVAS